MNEILKKAVENKNEEYLIKFLDFKEKKEIDSNQYDLLVKALKRRYDNELEPTLRKCIRVLKTIDSKKSNLALKKLKKLNNKNVNFVL